MLSGTMILTIHQHLFTCYPATVPGVPVTKCDLYVKEEAGYMWYKDADKAVRHLSFTSCLWHLHHLSLIPTSIRDLSMPQLYDRIE